MGNKFQYVNPRNNKLVINGVEFRYLKRSDKNRLVMNRALLKFAKYLDNLH